MVPGSRTEDTVIWPQRSRKITGVGRGTGTARMMRTVLLERRTEMLDCARISTPQTSKMVVDEGAGGVSSLPRMTVRR